MLPFSYWNKLEGGSEEWRTGLGGSELVSGGQGEALDKWGDLCSEEVTYFHILLSIVNKLLRVSRQQACENPTLCPLDMLNIVSCFCLK